MQDFIATSNRTEKPKVVQGSNLRMITINNFIKFFENQYIERWGSIDEGLSKTFQLFINTDYFAAFTAFWRCLQYMSNK